MPVQPYRLGQGLLEDVLVAVVQFTGDAYARRAVLATYAQQRMFVVDLGGHGLGMGLGGELPVASTLVWSVAVTALALWLFQRKDILS